MQIWKGVYEAISCTLILGAPSFYIFWAAIYKFNPSLLPTLLLSLSLSLSSFVHSTLHSVLLQLCSGYAASNSETLFGHMVWPSTEWKNGSLCSDTQSVCILCCMGNRQFLYLRRNHNAERERERERERARLEREGERELVAFLYWWQVLLQNSIAHYWQTSISNLASRSRFWASGRAVAFECICRLYIHSTWQPFLCFNKIRTARWEKSVFVWTVSTLNVLAIYRRSNKFEHL